MTHRVEIVPVRSNPMEVFLFTPPGDGPHPGIVLCQHIPVGHAGLENDTVTLKTAERYAENGYVVAVPFVFHWWPKNADIEVKRAEFRDDWTRQDLGAATNKSYKACAIFYGGRIKLPMGNGTPPAIELAPAIRCPVIGFFGNEDTNPSPADVNDYDAALTKAGIEHVFHRYDGAGHGFQTFTMPERYREKASEDAWGKVLKFLGEKLKT